MCQRAFSDFSLQKLRRDSCHGYLAVSVQFIRFVILCLLNGLFFWLDLIHKKASQVTSASVFKPTINFLSGSYFYKTKVAFLKQAATTDVEIFRLLPIVSALSLFVSLVSHQRVSRFPLCPNSMEELSQTSGSSRQNRTTYLEIPLLNLLDRNHFLTLVNGRSPP